MENFKNLQSKNPGLAEQMLQCSKDELLDLFAIEVAEKEELAEFKENYEETTTNLESIINFGIRWLKKNKKYDKHHIYIDQEIGKLIYTNTEKEFI